MKFGKPFVTVTNIHDINNLRFYVRGFSPQSLGSIALGLW
jgi:hypothetical protein